MKGFAGLRYFPLFALEYVVDQTDSKGIRKQVYVRG